MARVVYEGPGRVLQVDGHELQRGVEAEVPDKLVKKLGESAQHINLRVVPEEPAPKKKGGE